MRKYLVVSLVLCGLILAAVMVGPRSGMDKTNYYISEWILSDGAIAAAPRITSGCFYEILDGNIASTAVRCYVLEGETLRLRKFGLLAIEALGVLEECVFTVHSYQGANVSSSASSAVGDGIETGDNSDNTGVCSTVVLNAVNEWCEVDIAADTDSVIVGPGYFTVRITDNAGGAGGDACDDVLSVWLWVEGTITR